MSDKGPSFKDSSKLLKILEKNVYSDDYGGSIFVTVASVLAVIYLIVNNYVGQKKQEIKSNWKKERCNPLYMPVAGKINRKKNQTESEATSENMKYCLNNITRSVVDNAFKPVNLLLNSIKSKIKSAKTTKFVKPPNKAAVSM